MSHPVRMCTGCRERGDKAQLLRLVIRDGVIELDTRQVLPGRGAYLHPAAECLDKALKRRALGRALRSNVEIAGVERVVRPALDRRA